MKIRLTYQDLYYLIENSSKKILNEMAVMDEMDVYDKEPVASTSTETLTGINGDNLLNLITQHLQSAKVPSNYVFKRHEIGAMIRHHCDYRPLRKASLLYLPEKTD